MDILGPLHSFRHPQPILILHSHGVLLNLSGFFNPFTISFTFKVYWPFYQPYLLILSFGLIWPIFAYFPFLIILMGLLLFYLGSLGLACFFWGLFTILQAHGPLFLPFGFNGFLLTLLILLPHCLPYCWAFSCFWAFLPQWPSTTVLDSVLSFHSRFHFPVLRFQLLMAAFMSSFLSSHLYKY